MEIILLERVEKLGRRNRAVGASVAVVDQHGTLFG